MDIFGITIIFFSVSAFGVLFELCTRFSQIQSASVEVPHLGSDSTAVSASEPCSRSSEGL